MELNELMVGNCVQTKTGEIIFINEDNILLYGDYEPIELTPRWLRLLGFKKWNSRDGITYKKYQNKRELILHKRKRGWVINRNTVEPKYVHELQNIWRWKSGNSLKSKELNLITYIDKL